MVIGENPNCVYHYTNADGALGIINSDVLHATHARYLNDARELQYLAHHTALQLEKMLELPDCWGDLGIDSRPPQPEVAANLSDRVRLFIAGLKGGTESLVLEPLYVACFCRYGNLLSQWRGYALGTNGYALGFDRQKLCDIGSTTLTDAGGEGVVRYEFMEVDYGEAAAEKGATILARATLERFLYLQFFSELSLDEQRSVYIQEADNILASSFRTSLPSVKHEAFSQEHESRLVAGRGWEHFTHIRPEFKPSVHGVLVPYVKIPVSMQEALVEVIVGPSPIQTQKEHGMRDLLSASGLDGVSVQNSDTPFR